ncbi:MAG TPA: hypothetical protein VN969_19670 [Streptosporangiaceae bacterium]|nr:hypothetical protein [Streptosporangiaceae bacterium]
MGLSVPEFSAAVATAESGVLATAGLGAAEPEMALPEMALPEMALLGLADLVPAERAPAEPLLAGLVLATAAAVARARARAIVPVAASFRRSTGVLQRYVVFERTVDKTDRPARRLAWVAE